MILKISFVGMKVSAPKRREAKKASHTYLRAGLKRKRKTRIQRKNTRCGQENVMPSFRSADNRNKSKPAVQDRKERLKCISSEKAIKQHREEKGGCNSQRERKLGWPVSTRRVNHGFERRKHGRSATQSIAGGGTKIMAFGLGV